MKHYVSWWENKYSESLVYTSSSFPSLPHPKEGLPGFENQSLTIILCQCPTETFFTGSVPEGSMFLLMLALYSSQEQKSHSQVVCFCRQIWQNIRGQAKKRTEIEGFHDNRGCGNGGCGRGIIELRDSEESDLTHPYEPGQDGFLWSVLQGAVEQCQWHQLWGSYHLPGKIIVHSISFYCHKRFPDMQPKYSLAPFRLSSLP